MEIVQLTKTLQVFYEIGSVSKPLIMAIGPAVGKISMTDLYDVTDLKIGQHQI